MISPTVLRFGSARQLRVLLLATVSFAATSREAYANWRTGGAAALDIAETYNDSLFVGTNRAGLVATRQGDFITSFQSTFRLIAETERASHALGWGLNFTKFQKHGELDNLEQRLIWESNYELSRQTSGRFLNQFTHGSINAVSPAATPAALEAGTTGALANQADTYLANTTRLSFEQERDEITTIRGEAAFDFYRPQYSSTPPMEPTGEVTVFGGDAATLGIRGEYEFETARDVWRSAVGSEYAYIEDRADFITLDARERITRDVSPYVELRLEVGAAAATDADGYDDVYIGPVGSLRFKWENLWTRFVAEVTHEMGANVEFQTLEVEDAMSVGAEYMLAEYWVVSAGASGHLKRFSLPGAGNATDLQRISVLNAEVGLDWAFRDGFSLNFRYQARIQRSTSQIFDTQSVPFDLDYERNLFTLALSMAFPPEPRMTRLAPDEVRRHAAEESNARQDQLEDARFRRVQEQREQQNELDARPAGAVRPQ